MRFARLALLWLCAWCVCASYPFGPPIGIAPNNGGMAVMTATAVLTVGGSSTITGASFTCPTTVTLRTTSNGALPLKTTSCSTSSITVTVPAMSAGSYDLFIAGQGGTWGTFPALLQVLTNNTLSAIYGTNLVGSYPAVNAICSGGCTTGATVTGITDASSYGQNATCTGGVTYNASDSNFIMPGVATLVFDGSTGVCKVASFSLNGATTVYMLAAVYSVGVGGTQAIAEYGNNGTGALSFLATATANSNLTAGYNGANTSFAVAPLNGTAFVGIGGDANTGTTHVFTASVDNGVFAGSGSTTGTALPTTGALWMGERTTGANFSNMHTPEIDIVNVVPTTGAGSQSLQTTQNYNLRFGVTQPPVVSYVTPIQSGVANVPLRIQGTFEAGCTVTATGLGALTIVNNNTTTWIDATAPSATVGNYDLVVTAIDGRVQTFNDALVVQATANPESILGTSLLVWWQDSPNWSCPSGCTAGNNISSLLDLGGLQNPFTQVTGADQPQVYLLSDPAFNGHSSFVSTGSPVLMTTSFTPNVSAGVTPSAAFTWSCFILTATTGTQRIMQPLGGGGFIAGASNGSGKPTAQENGGTAATWGSSVGTSNVVCIEAAGYGTGTYTSSIAVNDDGVSAVTATTAGTPVYTAGGNRLPANSLTAHVGFGAISVTQPTTAQRKSMCQYLVQQFNPSGMTCLTIARGHITGSEEAWQAAALLGLVVFAARKRRAANDNAESEVHRAA